MSLRWLCCIAVLAVGWSSHAWAGLQVVCSIPDYCALAKAIGGEKVAVRSLTVVGQDPHYVDPKPSFMMHLNRAELLISNGLELEIGWLPKLVMQARNPRIQPGSLGRVVAAQHIAGILDVPTGPIDRSQGDVHPGGNPHFYHDPARMTQLIPVLLERLSQLSPQDADMFQQNARALTAQLTELVAQIRTRFARLSAQQRNIVTYHKSLSYLLDTLGLTSVAYIEPKPGVPPTPRHVARVLERIQRKDIAAIVQEAYYPRKTSSTLAQLGSIQLHILPGGLDAHQGYVKQMRSVIEGLYASLSTGREG